MSDANATTRHFPSPSALARAVGWFDHEIEAWLKSRASVSFAP
ncbi:MAG: AlpA family phage regulatory protein [Zoogloeaceae bacterium]|nr:AlpA family phage regulatory protein [Zoogloeaceae bacterium]